MHPVMRPPAMRRMAAVLVVALAAAACSSGASPSPSATTAPSAQPSASSGPSATPAPKSITIGLSQQIFSYSPIYVAQAKDFFKDENLTVTIQFFKAGSANQQAILGDAELLGAGGYTEPITLAAQGTPTVAFAFIQAALPYWLMTKPAIKTVDDLKGKVLAVSSVGSLSDQVTKIALNKAGLDPSQVRVQAAGGSPDRFAALKSGAVDGTILDSPTQDLALQAGFNKLLDVSSELKGFPYELLYAKKSTIDANKDVFLRFMRAFIRGATYFRDTSHEDEVLGIIAKALGSTVADAKIGYDATAKDFPPDGALSKDGLSQALDGTKKFGSIPGIDKVTVDDIYYADIQQQAAASVK